VRPLAPGPLSISGEWLESAVRATASKAEGVFFIRMDNSTGVLPADEFDVYFADHWPAP
jgi:hypothetical protein